MSYTVHFITSNPHKAQEVQEALAGYDITVKHTELDIQEIQSDLLEEVATHKVEQAFAHIQEPVIVDDAGMFFSQYGNFPGVMSRFVAKSLGLAGLGKLIEDGDEGYFASFIAYKASADAEPMLFAGKCEGSLVAEPRGTIKEKMPYDNVFIPKGDTRTFAEMSVAEKQQYDHRSQALEKFAQYIQSTNS